jgi:hypothetical protein
MKLCWAPANGITARNVRCATRTSQDVIGKVVINLEPKSRLKESAGTSKTGHTARRVQSWSGQPSVRLRKKSLSKDCWADFRLSAFTRPLAAGHDFTGAYDAVKRFVRRLAHKTEPPIRRNGVGARLRNAGRFCPGRVDDAGRSTQMGVCRQSNEYTCGPDRLAQTRIHC